MSALGDVALFALGFSYSHLVLSAPGGNSLGLGASAVLEGRYLELALSLYAHGGFGTADGCGASICPCCVW